MLTFLLTLLLLAPVALLFRGIASTGRRLAFPSGDRGEVATGAEDAADKDADDDTKGEADDDADDDDADDDDADDDKLKPEDDKNSVEYWKKRSRQNEREARRLRREAETGKPAGEADKKDQPSVDEIREQARAEARAEVLRERVTDKIEAKARGFANPTQAVAIVLHENDINDFLDGDKIDVEAIEEALDELLEKSPNLGAVQDGKRFKGGGDGGARKEQKAKPRSLEEAIAARISG